MTIASTKHTLPLLYVAHVETTTRLADLYSEYCIAEADDDCTAWFDADRDLAILEYFSPGRAETEHRLAAMEAFLQPHRAGDSWVASVRELPAQDWAESWKKFFHVEKVSDRVWIKPSWEPCFPAPGDIVVEIDPGMSFGTGQHGTTRGCLVIMDRLIAATPGLRLADIGCGSGILAIAAAKLGYTSLTALDNDPDAVRIATENATLNGVADRIRFMTGDLSSLGLDGTCDVVVANILAGVLATHAATLVRYLSPATGNRMVLSGILNPQAAEVLAAYEAQGMTLIESLQLGEWSTLLLRQK